MLCINSTCSPASHPLSLHDALPIYPNLARLDPAVWEFCMFNGRIFGLPFPSELITDAVFYRRDLFEELGVEVRSEEHTSELQSRGHLVCRLLLEKQKQTINVMYHTT